MYRLNLFGPLSLTCEPPQGTEQPVALSRRPGQLLAYLALSRGRHFSRGELACALWSDPPEGGASGALNTALWRLRGLLERPPFRHGELIVSDRSGSLGLQPHPGLRVDVAEFARLTDAGLSKSLALLDESDVAGLREGVALYRADVLTGFTDEWALREREQHRRRYLNALGRLAHLSTLACDYASAIGYAQAILDHDILREDVHRELIRLFQLSGQRALALRQFELCRAALRRELAIQPMRETLEVYQYVADHAIAREAAAPPPAAPPGVPPPAAPSARQLIEAARRSLAEADAQLQLSLPLFDAPPHAGTGTAP